MNKTINRIWKKEFSSLSNYKDVFNEVERLFHKRIWEEAKKKEQEVYEEIIDDLEFDMIQEKSGTREPFYSREEIMNRLIMNRLNKRLKEEGGGD